MKEWKGRWKKGLSVFLTMAVICSGVNVPAIPAFAEESVGKEQEEELAVTVPVAEDELPDSDELFAGYVEKVFYEGLNDGISTYGNLGEQRLQGEYNKKIYAVLKEKVKEVAAGKETNTIFKISLQGITSAAGGKIDIPSIMQYLLMDCPYELYWFDKTKGVGATGSGLTVTISFAVADEYKAGDYTVSSNLATVHTAAENARRIVEKYEGQSDYEKMVGYRKEICDLVSYNTDAAEKPTTPYGNPWQLIWVFDKNATTNVVCEGYAKAFQYLCDMSDFANATCYTVTGTMYGATGAGPHMWNIVTLGGKNYLVDVTNCDEGTVGADDKLFLAGADGSISSGYIVNGSVGYIYDKEQILLYDNTILTLSNSKYIPKTSFTVNASQNRTITYGDSVNAAHIKGSAATKNGTVVPGSFSWASDVTTYGNAGSKTLRAIFTPTDTNTYDSMAVNVQITVTPADYQVTVPSSQKVTSGVGTFTQPVFTGVNNEAVKGTLNYTYNNQTMNYESLKTALSKLAASTVTVEYSFTATDSNYKNAAKTGTLTFTIEQGPGNENNTDDNNSTDTDSGVLEGSGNNTDTGIYGTRLLTANPTTFNTIMLNWDAVAGAKSYEIFYSTSPNSGFKRLANVKKTFYKFSKAKCGVTYYFQMRVCQKGVKSEFGPISYGKTALTGSTTLQVKKTTYNSVTLRWNKVPGAKKYEIFCMDSMGKEWKSLGIKGGTSFTHKKLVTGATYYYQIRPVRDSFYGNYSNGVSSTTILGDISKLKVKAAGVDKMKLTWRKVKGATQYVILRAESIDGAYEVVGHSNKASYTDVGLKSGTTYFYKVYAISGPYRTKESSPIGQTTKFPKK
jgi:fibronectin type 3 domain-containing protein